MVKIINIDTTTRTIRIDNADSDIKTWRTTESGTHFPIKKGETTKEALDKFVEKKRPEAKKESTSKQEPGTYTMHQWLKAHKLTDNEIEALQKMQDYYDIDDNTLGAAIEDGTYTPQEILRRLRNYDDDFAEHLSDFVEPEKDDRMDSDPSGHYRPTDFMSASEAQKYKQDEQLSDLYENYAESDPEKLLKTIEDHYVNAESHYGRDSRDADEAWRDYVKASRILEKEPKERDELKKGRTLEFEPDKPSHPDDPRDSESGTDDNFHALWEKYVPDEGTADTLFGEMLRAAGRIRYRYYNDGDMYGYGYGKETVNNAISYLSKLAGGRDTEFKKELSRALYQATSAAAHYDEDEYKRQVDRIADAFASASWDDIQALASVKNETDSLTEYPDDTSYDDDDEDEEW